MQKFIRLAVIAVCAVMLVALPMGCKSNNGLKKGFKNIGKNTNKAVKKATKRR